MNTPHADLRQQALKNASKLGDHFRYQREDLAHKRPTESEGIAALAEASAAVDRLVEILSRVDDAEPTNTKDMP